MDTQQIPQIKGCSQDGPRHRTLTPTFAGSNPAAPTNQIVYVHPSDVDKHYDVAGKCIGGVQKSTGLPVEYGGIGKMSKSKNNGVNI